MSATSSPDSIHDAARPRQGVAASLVGSRLAPALVGALALAALGCGGGPPRRALPPSERRASQDTTRRERLQILGSRDDWADTLLIVERLEQVGGVLAVDRDPADGRFVVVYNPQRTHRDALVRHVAEIGDELGRDFEALFDDR